MLSKWLNANVKALHVPLWSLIVALAIFAYFGWNRQVQVVTVPVSQQVQGLTPGQVAQIVDEVIKNVKVNFTVSVPSVNSRQFVTPNTAIVPTQEGKQQAEANAPTVIQATIVHICLHPDEHSLPDPTCGHPVNDKIDFIQSKSGGFVPIQTPGEQVNTLLGPTTTTVSTPPQSSVQALRFGVGLGSVALWTPSSGLNGIVGPDITIRYNLSPSFTVYSTTVFGINGSGIGNLTTLNLEF